VEDRSDLSIQGAHTLAYSQPVKRCAEALWDRGDEESIDESSEGSKGTPPAEKSNAGGGKRKKKKSVIFVKRLKVNIIMYLMKNLIKFMNV
jgi:hypothetical protein